MSRRTRVLIAAAVVLNVTALAVLFWLVLDVRANGVRREPEVTGLRHDIDDLATQQSRCPDGSRRSPVTGTCP